jgi:hypothetical protein
MERTANHVAEEGMGYELGIRPGIGTISKLGQLLSSKGISFLILHNGHGWNE